MSMLFRLMPFSLLTRTLMGEPYFLFLSEVIFWVGTEYNTVCIVSHLRPRGNTPGGS